jgi:hypothetical protein
LIAAIVLLTGAGGYVIGRALLHPSGRVTQPIAFDHKKHTVDLGIECGTCHEYYAEGSHAGLPLLSTCMGCHETGQTDSPEEKKIRDMAAQNQDDVFRKLFRMPDHVFYSHRRHAGIAKLPCETCHGGIATTTRPPETPLVRINMDFCIDCHRQRNVSTDCTGCHR